VIKFYRHKTSKHVSADVLDSEEGHQLNPSDQTYDIICHMAYDSMGVFELSLTVVSTELSVRVRYSECVVPSRKNVIFLVFCFILLFISQQKIVVNCLGTLLS